MNTNNNSQKNKQKNLIVTVIILLIILIIISAILSNLKSKINKNEQEINVAIGTEENQNSTRQIDIALLKNMNERERMNYYFSYFMDLIENKSYETAYDLLYPEFKQNYFNTLSKFTQYVENSFPRMSSLNYTNIERNGNTYVLWVELTDVLDGKKDEAKEINVVIRENDFADIELSFSVEV